MDDSDILDVSLHDVELFEEVVLTAHLIVCANESERPLSQHNIDAILGKPTDRQ